MITKKEKEKLLDLLQDISYGFENYDFWRKWSAMHKYLSEIGTEPEEGKEVRDIVWAYEDGTAVTDPEQRKGLPAKAFVPEGTEYDKVPEYLENKYGTRVYSCLVCSHGSDELGICTPAGPIKITLNGTEEEYPGVFVTCPRKAAGEPGILMEYTPAGEDAGNVHLLLWTKDDPDGEPKNFPMS